MKKSRGKIKRTVAAIAAFMLIGLLLFITISFVGNPISAAKANQTVKKYIESHYNHLDLVVVQKAKYNFKDKSYVSVVQSKTINDLRFTIDSRNGVVLWDDYELKVLEYSNTLFRLSNEYTARVTKLLHEQLDKRYKEIRATYMEENIEKFKHLLELDMKFDPALPIDASLYVSIDLNESEKINLDTLAAQLIKIHTCLSSNGYPIAKYNLYMNKGENRIIGHFPAAIIEDEINLLSNLEKAYHNNMNEYKGIYVNAIGSME